MTSIEHARDTARSAVDSAILAAAVLNEHSPTLGHPELNAEQTFEVLGRLTEGLHNAAFAIEALLEATTPRRRRGRRR